MRWWWWWLGPLTWHWLVRLPGSSSHWWYPFRRIWQRRPQNTRHCWKGKIKESQHLTYWWFCRWGWRWICVAWWSHLLIPLNIKQIGVENINPRSCQICSTPSSTIPPENPENSVHIPPTKIIWMFTLWREGCQTYWRAERRQERVQDFQRAWSASPTLLNAWSCSLGQRLGQTWRWCSLTCHK